MTLPPGTTNATGALWKRGPATLSGGAYAWVNPKAPAATGATNRVHERNLSRYSPYKGKRDGTMGMGLVQAILALANGLLQTLSCSTDGHCGRLRVRSSSSAHHYDLTWDDRDRSRLIVGGLVTPRYQVAVAGFALLWGQWTLRLRGHTVAEEVVERWGVLLSALEAAYPPDPRLRAWSRAQLAAACAERPGNQAIRDAIEGLADALWLALRCRLPKTDETVAILCRPDPGLAADEGLTVPLNPAEILTHRAAGGVLVPVPARPDADHDLDLVNADTPEVPGLDDADIIGAVSAAEEATAAAADALVDTEAAALVRLAYAGEGAIFLCGRPGQGKTLWAKRLAREWGDGFELVELSEGIGEDDLFGTYVPGPDGRFSYEPGPLVRWARRVAGGERVALLLDELPRAHRSLVALVMKLLNTHEPADVAAQGLELPEEEGPYHILRAEALGQTFVLPDARLKIVATANLGERYGGMDLSDPALLDRWAYFIELGGMDEGQQRLILALHTGLAPAHPLFDTLFAVAREVGELDRRSGLRATLTLRTLLRWARQIVHLSRPTDDGPAPHLADAFVRVARVQWIDKIVPLDGDVRDPELAARVRAIVERHAPGGRLTP